MKNNVPDREKLLNTVHLLNTTVHQINLIIIEHPESWEFLAMQVYRLNEVINDIKEEHPTIKWSD